MTATANKKEYHYDLLERNRARVREQGAAINRSLKTIRHLSDTDMPAVTRRERDDNDITQQHITLPTLRAADQRLRVALEEAEADRESAAPPPMVKRWYNWTD